MVDGLKPLALLVHNHHHDVTRNILDCDQSNVLLAHLFDSPCGVSYRWSMVTRRLSGTVMDIFSLEDIKVTTLTFGVT